MKKILRCLECGKYGLKEKCVCNGKAVTPKPAKFSPEDPYGSYRREAKKEFFAENDLI